MSNFDDLDFDSILADFSAFSDEITQPKTAATEPAQEAVPTAEPRPAPAPRPTPAPAPRPASAPAPRPAPAPPAAPRRPAPIADELRFEADPHRQPAQLEINRPQAATARVAPAQEPQAQPQIQPQVQSRPQNTQKVRRYELDDMNELAPKGVRRAIPQRPAQERREKTPAPKVTERRQKAPAPKAAEPEYTPEPISGSRRGINGIIGIIFAVISILAICWIGINVHPDSGTATTIAADNKLDLGTKLNVYLNNAASDALGDLTYIKKIYTIPENALVAPKPNAACFGSTTNPEDIQPIIDSAASLLEGQEFIWDPNVDFFPGSEINYYYDSTILAIAWKEVIDNKVCTFSEIKIADGSQLRRKIANDTYGSSVQQYASVMAKSVNSVVAIDGDFYANRVFGITGYQRQIYRTSTSKLDTCFFTADGDMLFSYGGELSGEGAAQQFMDDNDAVFAISFGPVLVDNGELREISGYEIGEVNDTYSRAAIGMLGDKHYLLMTINYDNGYSVAARVQQSAQIIFDKGVYKAYALDGGQTSEMLMGDKILNHVDFGNERLMSDIIYFATAIPEEEVQVP